MPRWLLFCALFLAPLRHLLAEELALPPVKIHCSILAEDAIKAAVEDYRSKHGTGIADPVTRQAA